MDFVIVDKVTENRRKSEMGIKKDQRMQSIRFGDFRSIFKGRSIWKSNSVTDRKKWL